jgi:hypothetical protein
MQRPVLPQFGTRLGAVASLALCAVLTACGQSAVPLATTGLSLGSNRAAIGPHCGTYLAGAQMPKGRTAMNASEPFSAAVTTFYVCEPRVRPGAGFAGFSGNYRVVAVPSSLTGRMAKAIELPPSARATTSACLSAYIIIGGPTLVVARTSDGRFFLPDVQRQTCDARGAQLRDITNQVLGYTAVIQRHAHDLNGWQTPARPLSNRSPCWNYRTEIKKAKAARRNSESFSALNASFYVCGPDKAKPGTYRLYAMPSYLNTQFVQALRSEPVATGACIGVAEMAWGAPVVIARTVHGESWLLVPPLPGCGSSWPPTKAQALITSVLIAQGAIAPRA